jgi:hypothetical protein
LTSLTLAVVVATALSAAAAQTTGKAGSRFRVLTGIVTAVSASSLTIGRGENRLVFDLDSSTRFIGKGNATTRDLLLRRERRITDFVKAGDRVRVTYREFAGGMTAVEVRVAPK